MYCVILAALKTQGVCKKIGGGGGGGGGEERQHPLCPPVPMPMQKWFTQDNLL